MDKPIKQFSTPVLYLSDEQIEAQAFRDLEIQQRAQLADDGAIIIFQFPDNRTLYQHFRAWWGLRPQRNTPEETHIDIKVMPEPKWPRHWATAKYI